MNFSCLGRVELASLGCLLKEVQKKFVDICTELCGNWPKCKLFVHLLCIDFINFSLRSFFAHSVKFFRSYLTEIRCTL